MLNRRQFMGTIPASALAITAIGVPENLPAGSVAPGRQDVIAGPPVIQNPRADSFDVSIAVGGLATAWVEYGFDRDNLSFTAVASHHGLVRAGDRALSVRVRHPEDLPPGRTVFYRVVVQPLRYLNAYKLKRENPQSTRIFALRLPNPAAASLTVVSINDTHENLETITSLHQQIAAVNPDVLIWNGDTCNDFDSKDAPEQILLNPARDKELGWASTRPLLFSNGNHDVRGERAREVVDCFTGCPESQELPYNQALRFGPLAIVTLDTGEDKPDRHPVFAGTAAYEPYREQQARWLAKAVARDSIRSAPFRIATTHIPLRGPEGSNDGTTLTGYAHHSGFGARLWLPILKDAGFHAVLSGHTHRHRLDAPTDDMPIRQFVGGGPRPSRATLTMIAAKQAGRSAEMTIRIVDLEMKPLLEHHWAI